VSDPRRFLDHIVVQFWDAVAALADAAANSTSLAPLQPHPEYAAAPFNGRVLAQIDTLALADPVAAAGFGLLRALVPAAMNPANQVRLHGWDPGNGRPRSVALVLRPTEAPRCDVAAAVGRASDGAPFVHLIASATAAAEGTFGGGPHLTLNAAVPAAGSFDVEFRPGQARDLGGAPAATLRFRIVRADQPPLTIGAGVPRLAIHGVRADLTVTLGAGMPPAVALSMDASRTEVDVLPATIAGLLGGRAHAEISFGLQADGNGMQFARSGGTRALVPNSLPPGLLRIDTAAIELRADGASTAPLRLDFTFAVAGRTPGVPVSFAVDGVGAAFPFRIGQGGGFGFDAGAIAPLAPSGITAELTLPVASGAGFLATTRDGAFVGAFDLDLGFVAVRALAVLQPAEGRRPLSLAVLIAVEFPYPGIQLGLGFSLSAVGGIVAINRGVDLLALEAAVLDGRAVALLAPAGAESNPAAALATLAEIFPTTAGRVVVGPLLQVSWGGRLITITIALIFDLPNPPTLALLGRLTVAIPDPAVPLILIGVTFLAAFDPSIPMARITGTLTGSHIVFLSLQGDAFLLVAGGSQPNLVISAGGFHPAYPRPARTPALRRIGFDLCALPVPRMRAEMYFALTANSVQFGASVYLAAKLAGCGIEGRFSFDALCVFAPRFGFSVQVSGRVAVEAFGQTLVAVALDLLLEGPAPWHVRGRGSISLLWEDISFEFDETWGSPPPPILEAPPIEQELRRAFLEPRAWLPDAIGAERSGVVLHSQRGEQPQLHPLGRLHARQQRLPFNVIVQRYEGARIAPQLWEIAGVGTRVGQPETMGDLLRDEFPRAHYFELDESQQLAARGFTQEVSGVTLAATAVSAGKAIDCPDDDFDEKVVMRRDAAPAAPDRRRGFARIAATTPLFEAVLGSRRMHDETIWWADAGARAVVVEPTQPLAAASVLTLQRTPLPDSLEGRSEVRSAQLVAAAISRGVRDTQLVERWEVEVGP
jgi:hypothetical protein